MPYDRRCATEVRDLMPDTSTLQHNAVVLPQGRQQVHAPMLSSRVLYLSEKEAVSKATAPPSQPRERQAWAAVCLYVKMLDGAVVRAQDNRTLLSLSIVLPKSTYNANLTLSFHISSDTIDYDSSMLVRLQTTRSASSNNH